MLKGRLGIESARIPHADRHGVMWLGRGNLVTEDGTLHFLTAGGAGLEPGDYTIPFQLVSCLVLEPGTTITHDAQRLGTLRTTSPILPSSFQAGTTTATRVGSMRSRASADGSMGVLCGPCMGGAD